MREDNFWSNCDYYICPPVTEDSIINAEKKLGHKLPQSYINLMKTQNGGTPNKTCFPTKQPTSWAEDHISIESICGKNGEPQVIHVDVEVGKITFLAHNFQEFIEGLVDESQYPLD